MSVFRKMLKHFDELATSSKRREVMKSTFEIEWKDDLGEHWLNSDNVQSCLDTDTHCGPGLITKIKELPKCCDELPEPFIESNKSRDPICPDCNEGMVKTHIEHDDGSGWFSGWGCGCKYPESHRTSNVRFHHVGRGDDE